MNQSIIKKSQRKTQLLMKQQKDAKHRMYVLEQWLKTQITYNQDIRASIKVVKPKILEFKLIDQVTANKLFPQFQPMLKLSDNMIQIISKYKKQPICSVMIGSKLNQIVSFYKIYLQYFKHKSDIKKIYEEMQKKSPKQLKSVQNQLKSYFQQLYQQRAKAQRKDKNQTKNLKANITIDDCLQRPLYRLFKYHLLIDSYLKKLSQKHPDYVHLTRTRKLFVQIGEKCNDSFTQQQKQDLKYNLQKLYGRSLPQTSHYKTMMTAQTLYFPCKLYIFSNLIIISKAQKLIGFRQQKLYMNLGIDQFSFITYKKDIKYFKNVLLLCGIYECIHFILPDKGTRLQIYQLISKIIQQQKTKAFQKRQHKQLKPSNKLSFMLDQKQPSSGKWLTGLKIQVVDIDMRTLGFFSNDTAFIISILIPEYIDDEATFLKTNSITNSSQQVSKNGNYPKRERESMTNQEQMLISGVGPVQFKRFQTDSEFLKSSNYSPLNQHLQIHVGDLIRVHKKLRQQFPQINFPEIDPLSKDFNFYTQSKKKTKSFQVRAFLIEQFFNFVFRHPSIMENPMAIISELRIEENIWNYVVERSFYIQNQDRDEKMNRGNTAGNRYDQKHCQQCQESVIKDIRNFQDLRARKIRSNKIKKQNYCFNFYNLLRNNLLGLPYTEYNSLERMLLYTQYFEGRLDYCFLFKKNLAKRCKVVNILIPKLIQSSNRDPNDPSRIFHTACEITTDHKTTVGMIVNSISKDIQVFNMFDYRLIIEFNDQERVLDQDEYIYDLIEKYELQFQERTFNQNDSQFVGPRNSLREQGFPKTTMGFFNMIKKVLPTLPTINKYPSMLYLRKMVYFPLQLQVESIQSNFQRSKLLIAEVLQKISKSSTPIPLQIWGQICGLYYCILSVKQLNRISINTQVHPSIYKTCLDILPQQRYQLIKNKIFTQKMTNTITQHNKDYTNMREIQFLALINKKMIEVAYSHFRINTYFVPVIAKIVPNHLLLDNTILLTGDCFIGVNYNEIIVVRDKRNPIESIRMPLEDVTIVHSVYSLFLTYKTQNTQHLNQRGQKIEEFQLRFDNKMLHGFMQLCEKYKLLKVKFGAFLSDFS